MKKTFLLAIVMVLVSFSISFAWDDGQDDSDSKYESSTGVRYKYDLSNPSDEIMYEVDPAAQLNDSLNVDPRVDIDRGLGQYGGGIERYTRRHN